jgi:exodeoxyribonuclease VII small subunit
VAKEPKSEKSPEQYEDVVQRLDEVVRKLEGGQLSLEDSLKAFEDGVRLVQKGEKLLGDAEKRIEQLLPTTTFLSKAGPPCPSPSARSSSSTMIERPGSC